MIVKGMEMSPEMKVELLKDLLRLLPDGEKSERTKSIEKKLERITAARARADKLPTRRTCGGLYCGDCAHFASASTHKWGRCRKFRTAVGRYGKACEGFSPKAKPTLRTQPRVGDRA